MSRRTQQSYSKLLKLFLHRVKFVKEYTAPNHTDEDLVTWNARSSDTFPDFCLILIKLCAIDMPENVAIPSVTRVKLGHRGLLPHLYPAFRAFSTASGHNEASSWYTPNPMVGNECPIMRSINQPIDGSFCRHTGGQCHGFWYVCHCRRRKGWSLAILILILSEWSLRNLCRAEGRTPDTFGNKIASLSCVLRKKDFPVGSGICSGICRTTVYLLVAPFHHNLILCLYLT